MTRAHLAQQLGVPPEHVRVVSPHVGGGFGSKGGAWLPVLTVVAAAARQVGRPLRLALSRDQMFTLVGHRQPTIQRLRAGAARDGRLTALTHATTAETGLAADYTDPNGFATRLLYACPNVAVSHRLVRASVPMPNPMRAPGEATGTFALESALDELAHALDLDPVELRLRNDADRDPHSGRPWSSRSLRECYVAGRERFGWERRSPRPASMRDGRHLVGWGVATSTYSAGRWPAAATARLLPDGDVLVRTGSQDIGTGTRTVLAQVGADELGLPASRVRIELGDSDLPPAPPSAGQRTAASVAPAVRAAAAGLRERIAAAARAGESYAAIARRLGVIEAQGRAAPGEEERRFAMQAFGAHFVEVRVDLDLGEVRVTRVTAVYGAGRVLNPATARSQLIGGIVFGIGLALMEATGYDARRGRMVGTTLADYHVPVHADVPDVDVHLLAERDPYVNELGVKGIGMLGNVGTAPAIANAVFHATGIRVRDLPIMPDRLLASPPPRAW
jgi:xanthine dehydrogenase YagR molybdenum-binding subunit